MTRPFNNAYQNILLVLILGLAAILMFNAASGESAITDERAHIPAGFGYVKFLDYRLNPEHPPFIKALSALPLTILDLNFPTEHRSWTEDVNGQWDAGTQFLYKSGNDADQIVTVSRLFPIVLTLLTIVIIYIWSRELLGNWWALIPAFLFGLSPTVLTHGHYVTTDIGATFGILLATFAFTKFLLKPSKTNTIWAGIAFGIAQITKFSAALLIPYFLILTFLFYLGLVLRDWKTTERISRIKNSLRIFWVYLRGIVFVFVIGALVIYAVYFLFTINYPPEKHLTDATQILTSFSPHWIADVNLAMIQSPVLRPMGEYTLGLLMVLQRSAGGNTGYFLGEVSATGWWYYFPVVFLLKEPLPSLILIFFALGLGIWHIIKSLKSKTSKLKTFTNYLGTHLPEFAMLTFIVIYWGYSMRSPLNIGVRHLLPTMPFIYILSISSIKSWANTKLDLKDKFIASLFAVSSYLRKTFIKFLFLAILLLWYLGGTIVAAPYFLSYFNELGGGTTNGYRYVTDSNYDWGQDLKRLQAFVKDKNIDLIAVDYFGGGDPKYYLGENVAEYWWSARGNPRDIGIEWLAVSINSLQGSLGKTAPGFERKPEDEYRWLQELRPPPAGLGQVPTPDFRAGTSIFIYHL
ncbi:MAG: glycosyltransferase family 39 protein [Patescibacteria group bacterium]|nr:glycosyltransferase family 39 protein [Patescibacteria group bacterium]